MLSISTKKCKTKSTHFDPWVLINTAPAIQRIIWIELVKIVAYTVDDKSFPPRWRLSKEVIRWEILCYVKVYRTFWSSTSYKVTITFNHFRNLFIHTMYKCSRQVHCQGLSFQLYCANERLTISKILFFLISPWEAAKHFR